MKKLYFTACSALASQAFAHPGHGMPGDLHWHATDVAGLVFVFVGAAIAIWIANK